MYEKLQKVTWMDGMLISGLILIALGIGMSFKNSFEEKDKKLEVVTKNEVQVYKEVTFDVSGEVLKPGVYTLGNNQRLVDALAVAGGLTINADRDWVEKNINRAELLKDGMKIYIPKKEIVKTGGQLININTGTVEELDKLSGVGPFLASKIVEYRLSEGRFKSIEDLKKVSGVGEKLYESIKNKVEL
ncbi:MAG TPA: helix-hairpin-helix domain-containing protein [Candidatus Woesebacteria bacterium]|nr:helix-hairpin-helix domain-containing protein [Candidatus Woesebacteria bacterium]